MRTVAFSTFLGPVLALSIPAIALQDACHNDDVHSHPDLHACHHVEMEPYEVSASQDLADAPEVSTTQEAHGHFEVTLPRQAGGYQGYVSFQGLEDSDVYVIYWTDPTVEPVLLKGDTGMEVSPIPHSEDATTCDAFAGRLEFPVNAEEYVIELRGGAAGTGLLLEAWSQY